MLAAIVAISTTVMALYGFDKETITVAADDDTTIAAVHNAVMGLTKKPTAATFGTASCMRPT